MKNISIRVPWHEEGWSIYDEECPYCSSKEECIRESGRFMCGKLQSINVKHPYVGRPLFKKLDEQTGIQIAPFSFLARPFRWMLTENKNAEAIANYYPTMYDKTLEEQICKEIDYESIWVTHGKNQKTIFEYFYKNIQPGESLIFPYSKRCSLTETYGRILIGIGHVSSIGELNKYDGESEVEPLIWERCIGHSIRHSGEDGFLFPFSEIKQFLATHPDRNPDDFLVIVPQEYQLDYSYATDYVSTDATIWTLNRAREVLRTCELNNIGDNIQQKINWIDQEIEKAWSNRPTYPGLGAFLSTRIKYGFDLADSIERIAKDNNADAVEMVLDVIEHREKYSDEENSIILNSISDSQIMGWRAFINSIGIDFAKNLCQFELDAHQMKNIIELASNKDFRMAFIDNPYILYEKTLGTSEEKAIRLQQIDYAVLPKDKRLTVFRIEPDDKRRLRALLLRLLQEEATLGNTICLREKFIDYVQNYRTDLEFMPLDRFTLDGMDEFFKEYVVSVETPIRIINDNDASEDHTTYYKTVAMQEFDDVIVSCINSRLNQRCNQVINWKDSFKEKEFRIIEERPRIIDALNKLTDNSFSILTGGAGTAKTSVVVKFCKEPRIHMGRVLFLAPTGKAAQVFAKEFEGSHLITIQTIAQFLLSCGRWDSESKQYSLRGKTTSEYTTVIIDECSMITEPEFATLLDVIKSAKRVILVGDSNQLPPIGAGRPFLDTINYVKAHRPDCFIELKYNWRQKNNRSFDVDFAKLFTSNPPQIDDILETDNNLGNIELIRYESLDEIPNKAFETVARITGMDGIDDQLKFDESIGGSINDVWMNFDRRFMEKDNEWCWQVISPYKNKEHLGTRALNKLFHEKYRQNTGTDAFKYARTRYPYGEERIVLGDKVINTVNTEKDAYEYSTQTYNKYYLPNGATGLVCGIKNNQRSSILNIVFSNNPKISFGYKASASSARITDNDRPIELAYALTAHKVQGSTYHNTIIVLYDAPNSKNASQFISRELIYTALTRHKDKIYLIYNKELKDLLDYMDKSDVEARLTDLFKFVPDSEDGLPPIIKYDNSFYNNDLKHIAIDGTKVRSKSELIIANQLHFSGLEYQYESHLLLNGGRYRRPDFRIIAPSGKTVYWEHLGMLGNAQYKEAWEKKRKEYEQNGITEKNGNLIITEDDLDGGLDSRTVEEKIDEIKKK